jgi:hypothetical protein
MRSLISGARVVDGGTYHGRERRIDKGLSADDHKHTLSPGIRGGGVLDSVQVATLQGMTWYERTSSASWFSSTAWALMISKSREGARLGSSGKYSLKAASTSSERCSGSGARLPRAATSSSERKMVVSIFILSVYGQFGLRAPPKRPHTARRRSAELNRVASRLVVAEQELARLIADDRQESDQGGETGRRRARAASTDTPIRGSGAGKCGLVWWVTKGVHILGGVGTTRIVT